MIFYHEYSIVKKLYKLQLNPMSGDLRPKYSIVKKLYKLQPYEGLSASLS